MNNFKKYMIWGGKIPQQKEENVEGESGKTRKKSGKSQGIPGLKFGRHPGRSQASEFLKYERPPPEPYVGTVL